MMASSLACTLVRVEREAPAQGSDVTPANTDNWVGFQGRGVQMGAPPGSWTLIPSDDVSIQNQFVQWVERDRSVSNLFLELTEQVKDDFYRLVLMKDDGTAWVNVAGEPLQPDATFADILQKSRDGLLERGIQPRNERTVELTVGRATRWETAYSPRNSQIVDRQFQYIVQVGGEVYYLTFNAQAPDFDDYTPVFEAMALSFATNPN
jgi:hypothetical protein